MNPKYPAREVWINQTKYVIEQTERRVDMDICGDNRFEIIAKAKKHLLDATNIDTSPKEMEVLDNFLFRCWQMGWLDRYDIADTPQNERSE